MDYSKQKTQELLKLRHEHRAQRCGSCQHWMTRKCPREATRCVSMGDPGCSEFSIDAWYAECVALINQELAIRELEG